MIRCMSNSLLELSTNEAKVKGLIPSWPVSFAPFHSHWQDPWPSLPSWPCRPLIIKESGLEDEVAPLPTTGRSTEGKNNPADQLFICPWRFYFPIISLQATSAILNFQLGRIYGVMVGFPDSSGGKESTCNAGDPQDDSRVRKICWRRDRLHTPGFWPGEFHRLYSPWGRKSQTWLNNFHYGSTVRALREKTEFLPWLCF